MEELEQEAGYAGAMEALVAAYESMSAQVAQELEARHPRPEAMKPEAYRRTLRARAFDAGRYLLAATIVVTLGVIIGYRPGGGARGPGCATTPPPATSRRTTKDSQDD